MPFGRARAARSLVHTEDRLAFLAVFFSGIAEFVVEEMLADFFREVPVGIGGFLIGQFPETEEGSEQGQSDQGECAEEGGFQELRGVGDAYYHPF